MARRPPLTGRTLPRGVRAALLVGGAVLLAAVFGVTTASAELNFGPHLARYDVTTDSTVTIDLGPLGTLEIDSPLPLSLGARVTVQEIPADVVSVDRASTLEALAGDLQSYLQFFSGPDATARDATRALLADAAWRTLLALGVLAGVWFGGRWLLGPRRRGELAARTAPHARQAVVGGVVLVLVLVTVSGSLDTPPADAQPASQVFAGTPLEGARVTGRLGGVIDTYGGYAVDLYRENQAFYADADASLVASWEERNAFYAERAEEPPGEPTAAPSITGPTAAGGTDPDTTGDAATATPTDAAADAPVDEADLVVLLVVSDLHCNVGMAPLISSAVRLSGADVVLDAGDTTIDGSAVEQYCVTSLAGAVPSGVDIVVSDGNHDSEQTQAQQRRAGMTVLDGDVVEVRGMRVLGDSDPAQTRLGAGTSLVGRETPDQVGRRLSETACADDDGVDLLLVHNPVVGDVPLEDGCVPVQVSGHMHVRIGPYRAGQGVRYVSSSTAGASLGQPTVGPLRGNAEMTVLRWDPEARRFVDYQVVVVRPDASAFVGYRLPFPGPAAEGIEPDRPVGPR